MFKNLKAKVKQEASLDTLATVQSPQTRNKPFSLSDVETFETASNSSKLATTTSTDEPIVSRHNRNRMSSSEEKSHSSKTDESVTVDGQITADNTTNDIEMSQNEIELIKEKNQIIVEKLKFQSYNDTLLKKIDALNVSAVSNKERMIIRI